MVEKIEKSTGAVAKGTEIKHKNARKRKGQQMKSKIKVQELTKMSLCVAILCVASFFVIPLPFTPIVIGLQTVMVNTIGLILSPKEAGGTILTYLLMGLIGLPVFSGGTSGPAKLFGPTGGFYFGFFLAVVGISLLKGKKSSFLRYCLVTILVGIPIQHSCAVFVMCIYNGWNVKTALLTVSLPFLAGDVLKCVMASAMGVSLNRTLK